MRVYCGTRHSSKELLGSSLGSLLLYMAQYFRRAADTCTSKGSEL